MHSKTEIAASWKAAGEFQRYGGDASPPQAVSYETAEERSIRKIDQLNLECVEEKLQAQHGWSVERCKVAENDYRRFLKLAFLERGKEISPLGDIDEMWHTHILFTKKYHHDCQAIFGRYMHHNPLFSDKDAERLAKGRASTRAMFLKHFGECTELVDSCGCGNSGGNCCGNDS